MANPYEDALALRLLFSQFEYALKNTGYLKVNREDAEADWDRFAHDLGPGFYEEIQQSGVAQTLLLLPPRKQKAAGLAWGPEQPAPLKNVVELFVVGVCRVRNNYLHGGKFVGSGNAADWNRDALLVEEALAVLRAAEHKIPEVAEQIPLGPKI
jgi:hypothetical protein